MVLSNESGPSESTVFSLTPVGLRSGNALLLLGGTCWEAAGSRSSGDKCSPVGAEPPKNKLKENNVNLSLLISVIMNTSSGKK